SVPAPEPGPEQTGASPPSPARLWRVPAAIAIAVAVLIGAYLLFNRGAGEPPAVVQVPTIPVLPFLDMSPSKDQEYFVDGLTEELTDHLSRIPGMRVVARTSTFAYKGKHEDLRQVAQQLGAQHLLEGSVRRDGEALRITAQLIDANGKHIWSQTYDRR